MMNDQIFDELPKGIQSLTALPEKKLSDLWRSIVIDDELRNRLLSQAVLNFSVRRKVSRTILPLHGVIFLVGLPGTGKTSLAKGLANKTAEVFKNQNFRLIEVEAHGLTSSAMGKTQRAVADLFSQTISELASAGPTIVLLDEVETLAVDRAKLSLEANPVDVHRATDAVLVQLDILAETHKNLLFIATSNFPSAVDSAFISRCDLVLELPLPDEDACKKILIDCLTELGTVYPKIPTLLKELAFDAGVTEFVGLDGRTIRKVVANALASSTQVALNPETLTISHIVASAKLAQRHRVIKGV